MTLFIIKEDGTEELLDMGKFGTIYGPNDNQETFSENTTIEQRKNRLILLDAATKVGLVNYGFEWWHYSYGDQIWAYVKKQKQAICGPHFSEEDTKLPKDTVKYLTKIQKEKTK